MKNKLLLAPAALLLMSAAEPAPDKQADLRCLFVSLELAGSEDTKTSEAGVIHSLYFLGKVDGGSPGTDIEALILREATRMTGQERSGMLIQCAAELGKRGAFLEELGKRMENAAQSSSSS